MDYRIIVWAEQDMLLVPHVAPAMSSNDNWEELFISNRLLLLRRHPRNRKPVALLIDFITKWSSCIRWHLDIRLWDQTWEKPKTNAMPGSERKCCHRTRSKWNSLLGRTGWAFFESSIKGRSWGCKKVLPGQNTLLLDSDVRQEILDPAYCTTFM